MASLAAVLDPASSSSAAGLSTAGELLREPAMRTLQERITAQAYREVPTVRIAELGPAVAVGENGTAVGQGTAWDTEDGGGGSDERARFVQ